MNSFIMHIYMQMSLCFRAAFHTWLGRDKIAVVTLLRAHYCRWLFVRVCVYKNRIIACMIFFSVCDDISMSQLLSIIPVLLKWLKQRKCFMAQACAFILIPIFLSLSVRKAITVTTKYRFSPSSFLITERLLYWIAKYMKEIRYLTGSACFRTIFLFCSFSSSACWRFDRFMVGWK